MLPPFHIRHLRASNNPSGPDLDDDFLPPRLERQEDAAVRISEEAYDKLIAEHPEAQLTYLDDDDGEVITVGSSHELKLRLEEPVPQAATFPHYYPPFRYPSVSRPARPRLSHPSPPLHVFDVDRNTNGLDIWQNYVDGPKREMATKDRAVRRSLFDLESNLAKDFLHRSQSTRPLRTTQDSRPIHPPEFWRSSGVVDGTNTFPPPPKANVNASANPLPQPEKAPRPEPLISLFDASETDNKPTESRPARVSSYQPGFSVAPYPPNINSNPEGWSDRPHPPRRPLPSRHLDTKHLRHRQSWHPGYAGRPDNSPLGPRNVARNTRPSVTFADSPVDNKETKEPSSTRKDQDRESALRHRRSFAGPSTRGPSVAQNGHDWASAYRWPGAWPDLEIAPPPMQAVPAHGPFGKAANPSTFYKPEFHSRDHPQKSENVAPQSTQERRQPPPIDTRVSNGMDFCLYDSSDSARTITSQKPPPRPARPGTEQLFDTHTPVAAEAQLPSPFGVQLDQPSSPDSIRRFPSLSQFEASTNAAPMPPMPPSAPAPPAPPAVPAPSTQSVGRPASSPRSQSNNPFAKPSKEPADAQASGSSGAWDMGTSERFSKFTAPPRMGPNRLGMSNEQFSRSVPNFQEAPRISRPAPRFNLGPGSARLTRPFDPVSTAQRLRAPIPPVDAPTHVTNGLNRAATIANARSAIRHTTDEPTVPSRRRTLWEGSALRHATNAQRPRSEYNNGGRGGRLDWEVFLESYGKTPGRFPEDEPTHESSEAQSAQRDPPTATRTSPPVSPAQPSPPAPTSAPAGSSDVITHSDASSVSNVQKCVEMLKNLGFGGAEDGGLDRLVVYAQAAAGVLDTALEIIEEERKAWSERL